MKGGPNPSPALFAHMVAAGAARAVAFGFAFAAALAALCDARGAALALALTAGAFRLAEPAPRADLDRETGR